MVGSVQYAEFAISDLFSISRGDIKNRKSVIELDKVQDESVSFIAQNNSDNGYVSMVDPEERKVFPGNSIIIGRQTGVVYYQKGDFVTTDGVLVMEPTFGMDERIGLFITSAMTKLLQSFGYDNTVSATKLNNMVIELPTTASGQPDFDYMENYIKEIEQKHVAKLKSDLETRMASLLTFIGRTDLIGNMDALADIVNRTPDAPKLYDTFKVGEVFTIQPTKKLTVLGSGYIKDAQIISDEGTTPYIAAVSTNNGISGYSIYEPTNEKGAITLSTTADSSNTIFYQDAPFIGRQQMAEIRRKDGKFLTKRVAFYIITLLKKMTSTFNYGDKLRIDKLQNMTFDLPVTPSGTPDFEFMEQYIAHIELKYTHTDAMVESERIAITKELVE